VTFDPQPAARLLELLREQQQTGFRDVAGAHASVTLPVSDRLVSRLVADAIPPGAPVRELDLRASAGNRFSVRVRLARPAFLPPITIHLQIIGQPQFPANPVLQLRLLSSGLLSFAGAAMRFLDALPPGIRIDGDVISVNVRTLAERRGFGAYLDFVRDLQIATEEGRFIVSLGCGVPTAVQP
jgi:hypothetical protein